MTALDISGYSGEWVAIKDNEVVAHARHFEDLERKTKDMRVAYAVVPSGDFHLRLHGNHIPIR